MTVSRVTRLARAALLTAAACLSGAPAGAMVGGAGPADPALARHVVMVVGSRGNFCTATVIGADLLLTAAHCVLPGADYRLVQFDGGTPRLEPIAQVVRHPGFSLQTLLAHRATADVAVLKLARPLGGAPTPARIAVPRRIAVGERILVVGYGLATRGEPKSGGTARAATLAATGRPGNLQLRLADPANPDGKAAGLGACTGNSGAPAFDLAGGAAALMGVVSWSTGPGNGAGCGGLTGVTPLGLYRDWLYETARRLGSPLP